MNFESELLDLSAKVKEYIESQSLQTEEATKFAIIMPFLSRILGYDVFNPQEVVPEFTADVGIKNGEKVDYAIIHGGEVQILIEAKPITANLSKNHASQLYRYFTVTKARIGVLTNGRIWQFYSDLERPNVMDQTPFLTIDLTEPERIPQRELKKFSKDSFDLNSVISSAEDLKYLSAFKAFFADEFENPSAEFIKLAARNVYDGKLTSSKLDTLRPLAVKAIKQVIQERVTGLFQRDLQEQEPKVSEVVDPEDESTDSKGIETTVEEISAFYLIRGIMHPEVDPTRITFKDTQTYFGIQVDGNSRKTWIRLYVGRTIRIQFGDTGERIALNSIEEIGEHRERLMECFTAIERGLTPKWSAQTASDGAPEEDENGHLATVISLSSERSTEVVSNKSEPLSPTAAETILTESLLEDASQGHIYRPRRASLGKTEQ